MTAPKIWSEVAPEADGLFGWRLHVLRRYWLVVQPTASPEGHLRHYCLGDWWSLGWDDHMALYRYWDAVHVATDVGGYAINLADLVRVLNHRNAWYQTSHRTWEALREVAG